MLYICLFLKSFELLIILSLGYFITRFNANAIKCMINANISQNTLVTRQDNILKFLHLKAMNVEFI